MTTLAVTCHDCDADLTLQVKQVIVTAYSNRKDSASLGFACPECGAFNERHIDKLVFDALSKNGATVDVTRIPQEFFESHQGPTLTLDDLLDLHADLEDG